ncbi:hypothetical protein GCM10027568_14800 [Humibacter soli]
MDILTETTQHLEGLRCVLGDGCDADRLAATTASLSDADVLAVIAGSTAVISLLERVRVVASGVAAARSSRDLGQAGLAQSGGHRSSVELLQELTGMSRSGAAKQVRLGQSLLAAEFPAGELPDQADGDGTLAREVGPGSMNEGVATAPEPWHAPLGRALLAGALSTDQHDAILRGLGTPPVPHPVVVAAPNDETADQSHAGAASQPEAAAAIEAWSVAAEQLIGEAACRTVEELGRAARSIRDRLDPAGADARFQARYDARSFRIRTADDGTTRGWFAFDDEGAAWIRSIIDSALRPRRGGPRFVDPSESEQAELMKVDPRTNDQLAYDLVLDLLRAGALTEAETVYGTRQAGVRLVAIADSDGKLSVAHPAHWEEDGGAVPAWLAGQHACDTGTRSCTLDSGGNPLDLGREQRCFSSKQKVAMSIRDGGCRWSGCDRPASYCEAHHIDEWAADNGRTDVDRGILLCRFHHMQLHHGGWRITRNGKDDFLLHPPGATEPVALPPRLTLHYAWRQFDPPPRRFQFRTAA